MNGGQYTYYDLLAHLVPGLAVLVVGKVLVEGLGLQVPSTGLESFSTAGIAVVAAYLVGVYLQAVGSACERVYFRVFCGGKPSKMLTVSLLKGKKQTAASLHLQRIAEYYRVEPTEGNADLLFTLAKDYVDSHSLGRVGLLLAVYTLLRGLLTMFWIVVAMLAAALVLSYYGVEWFTGLDAAFLWKALAGAAILLLLTAARFSNRSRAYAREIIAVAGTCLRGASNSVDQIG